MSNFFVFKVSKGISANMLKISSKRRRTLAQIKAEKEAAAQKERDIEEKLAQFEQMQAEMAQMRQDMETGKAAANLMSKFINNGMCKQTGEHEITVPHPEGDKVFTAFADN